MADQPIRANCPECDYPVDDATGVGEMAEKRPSPGSIAICIRCAGLGVYIDGESGSLALRAPTDEERVELEDDDEITKVRVSILFHGVFLGGDDDGES